MENNMHLYIHYLDLTSVSILLKLFSLKKKKEVVDTSEALFFPFPESDSSFSNCRGDHFSKEVV